MERPGHVAAAASSNASTGRTNCSRQPDGRLKKSGPRVRAEEFEDLNYARSIGLPVPAAHEFLPEEQTILMDFVEGDTLESVWPTLSESEKESIARQLGQFISSMRSGRQDEVYIGAINGPARDCRRFSDYTGGPFTDETSFNAFVCNLYKQCPKPIRDAFIASMRTDHAIRFTHGDLSPRNIIVKDGKLQAVVDWEFAGWYPEHFEYVKFFECTTDNKDWKDFASYIFEVAYGEELVVHQAILRWQRA
jgi:aminoglycoside phosphotransferase (APT) family kinase protein